MAYTHTQLSTLRAALAQRLDDTGNVFWVSLELDEYLNEALRTWQAVTGFQRARDVFSTTSGTSFYELQSEISSVFGFSRTDSDLVKVMQYQLLEAATGTSWTGTDMFTLADVMGALQRRRDQFLSETGIVLSASTQNVPPPPIGRVSVSDRIIDIRRLVWEPVTGPWRRLWREGEMEFTSFDSSWAVNPDKPSAYSILSTRPLEIQLSPHPNDSGTMHLVTVSAGSTLLAGGQLMGIPDNWCWVVKWGALADLLGKDGQARDPQRASYCEDRYRHGIALARTAPSVIHCEINGVPLVPQSLQELDAYRPGWEGQKRAEPQDFAVAGHNLVALHPVPNGIYSATVDVVRRADTLSPADQVQVGREQLDVILDYAEHVAAFKMGGAEFAATAKLLERFLMAAKTYNQRITASAPRSISTASIAIDDMRREPRMLEGKGVGTLA